MRVHAVRLASRGWPVFPCRRDNKQPLVTGGFKAATVDESAISNWWGRWPDAMIGVPTGVASGIVVLDIDRDERKGIDGHKALAALERQYSVLPRTLVQSTPRGGEHLLFAVPNVTIRNSASKVGACLDIRGDGGYIIVAPSINADGRSYRWMNEARPAEMPDWLVGLLTAPATTRHDSASDARPHLLLATRPVRYAEAALEGELSTVAQAPDGRRNDALNRSAFKLGQLVGSNALDRGTVEVALVDAASASGLVAEDGARAVRRTIDGGLAAGMARPRDIPAVRTGPAAIPALRDRGLPTPDDERFDLTEDGIALAFAARYGNSLRFCHHAAKWYLWTGSRWQKQETRLALHWAREVCREINSSGAATLSKAATAAAVERFAQADPAFAVTSAIWDTDPFLIGTPGGVVDLRTGTLRPAERSDFITRLTAVAPDATGSRASWDRFLAEATLGDCDLQRFLQQVAGYSLSGDVREHALFFVYGPGGNGKSVFLNVLSGIMGDYATTSAMDTFSASALDRHPTDLAMLQGARLVSASETEEGRAWAESRIKQMTGGDAIRARFMRQDFFEYKPQFKLVIVGNHKPVLRNVDEAARRRFNIIPFIHKPFAPDRQLEAKLKAEWPAILAWAIEGALDWKANGLVRPTVVTDATAEYFSEQDSVMQWVDERCETGGRSISATTAALFASWSSYALSIGEQPGTIKSFSQSLQRHGFQPVAETPGHRKCRGFLGIALRHVDTSGQWQNRMEANE